MQCLLNNSNPSNPISEAIYTPNDTASYSSVLQSYIQNQRFNSSSKPFLILTALHVSHVQTAVVCASTHGVQMKIRSGGHDYEGLSYVSLTQQPFFILDMFNLRSVDVDIPSETAWIQTGAILGEVYYRIAEKSNVHGFPAGICPTVGVGGHVSGGGYGNMLRQHGLTVDNVVDAMLVDVNGTLHDRKSMGEDLFWAIRGGGAASFGVVISYKIKLVRVPEIVTTFDVKRKMEEGASDIFYRWQQVSTNLSKDLFIRDKKNKFQISFIGEYLGRVKDLVQLLNESFPELGFKEEDGKEMSWLDSVLFWVPFPEGTPAEALLSQKLLSRESIKRSFKSKSDYVKEVIPKEALPQIWDLLLKTGAAFTQWNPYGGRMAEIPTDRIAYPHRAGYLFKVQYFIGWTEEGEEAEAKHIAALTALHDVVTPYVTKEPREAFFNYRDLDNGENSVDYPNWEKAKVYGEKYFKGHFERLSKIKRQFDPENFFRDQQSIPPFPY
ncbi:Berberine bridge enzyme-like 7 [Linum grandiflorum]